MAQFLHIGVFAFHSTKILSKVALVSSILHLQYFFPQKILIPKTSSPIHFAQPFFWRGQRGWKKRLEGISHEDTCGPYTPIVHSILGSFGFDVVGYAETHWLVNDKLINEVLPEIGWKVMHVYIHNMYKSFIYNYTKIYF